jgi:hypothetical protein
MSRRKLPLKSPHWVPITQAFEWRLQQTDSIWLVVLDFDKALRDGELRALVRGADGQSELLARTVWDNDLHIAASFSLQPTGAVFSRKLGESPPMEQWFFVWQPDYVRIFVAAGAVAAAEPRSQVAPPTRGPEGESKLGAPLKHDWIVITTEVAFREANATKKQRVRSVLAEAKSVRAWCGRHLKKRPPISELRELVANVRRRLRWPE